jgi:hypothetical protein
MNSRKLIEGADGEDDPKDELLSNNAEYLELYNPDGEDWLVHSLLWEGEENRKYVWGTWPNDDHDVHWVCGVKQTSTSSGNWFIFFINDCFDPPMYAINGNSFEDAYEEFIDWKEAELRIDDADLADYGGDVHYSPNGVPVDTESIQGFDVKLVKWS